MLIPFDEMPTNSRIWIYQAAQPLNELSKNILSDNLNSFLTQWESHGATLKSSWKLFYDLFIIIAIDESYHAASGCSIDKSVNILKHMESELGIELLGKNKIALIKENAILQYDLKEIRNLVKVGELTSNSIIFNNLASNITELTNNWKIQAGQSWLSRYFNN